MGRGVARLETAALINRHVDQRRPRLQLGQLRPADQLGCRSPRDQHRADDQIGPARQINRRRGIGKGVLELPAEHIVKITQPVDRPVQHGHIRPHSGGDPRGLRADHTAPQHQHARRQHTRHTAQQHPAPAVRLLQRPGPDLRRKPPRDFRHRGQQRQPAARIGDGLIGDAGRPRSHQIVRLLGVGGKVQIGEQHLPLAQPGTLDRLRLLDLDDQVGRRENLLGGRHHQRPRSGIIRVGEPRADPGTAFDENTVAVVHRLTCSVRRQANAVFLRLDLFRATDLHVETPSLQHQRRAVFVVGAAHFGGCFQRLT